MLSKLLNVPSYNNMRFYLVIQKVFISIDCSQTKIRLFVSWNDIHNMYNFWKSFSINGNRNRYHSHCDQNVSHAYKTLYVLNLYLFFRKFRKYYQLHFNHSINSISNQIKWMRMTVLVGKSDELFFFTVYSLHENYDSHAIC